MISNFQLSNRPQVHSIDIFGATNISNNNLISLINL